jgi:hypothetical protein
MGRAERAQGPFPVIHRSSGACFPLPFSCFCKPTRAKPVKQPGSPSLASEFRGESLDAIDLAQFIDGAAHDGGQFAPHPVEGPLHFGAVEGRPPLPETAPNRTRSA